MKFFKNRTVAWVVLVLAIAGSVCIGFARKDHFISKEPVELPTVSYQQWICDDAGMLSDGTREAIARYNSAWDSKYYAVIAVATVDDITGWTPEEAAQRLGADWGLAGNDMLLLMVRNDDYYVACGDNVLTVLNNNDTMLAKLKQAIETLYYNGDFDGAALAFYRQADVFYAQAKLSGSGSSGSAGYTGGDTNWEAPMEPISSTSNDVLGVLLLIIAIFVVWALLDRVRYSRYRRRYVMRGITPPVAYYPIFWGRRPPRPHRPRPPRPPRHGGSVPPRPPMGGGAAPRPPRPSQPRPRPSAPRPPMGGSAPRPPRPSAPRPGGRPNGGSRPSGGRPGGFGGGGFGGGSRGGSRGGGFGGGGFGGGRR